MKSMTLLMTVAGIIFFSISFPGASGSADFPTRPLQIVVPFPPGGSIDIMPRILAPRLAEYLGKPVTILNKAGAGGAAGLQFVAGSKPDGYTIVTTPPNIVTIPYITPNITFSYRDFEPVSMAVNVPYVLVVESKSSFRSLDDLVDYGKKNPEKLNHGGSGAGAVSTFMGEWFSVVAGIKITQIPFVGEVPAIMALLGGKTHFNCCGISTALSYIKSGQVRVLAIMNPARYKGLPDVPTIGEKGYPDCTFTNWHMYMVPANTPKQIVDRLSETFQKVLKEEETIKALENVAAVIENRGPAEAAKVLKSDDEMWSKIIKRVGVQPPGK